MTVRPASACSCDDLFDQAGVDRVEPCEGLVHDDKVGFVQQRGDELGLLLHPLAQLLHLLAPVLVEVHALEPRHQAALGLAVAQTLERAKIDQYLARGRRPCIGHAPREDSRSGPCRPLSGAPPSISTRPESGLKMSSMMRMVVVLPAPFGPRRPKTWPGSPRTTRPPRPACHRRTCSDARLPLTAASWPWLLLGADCRDRHIIGGRQPRSAVAPACLPCST